MRTVQEANLAWELIDATKPDLNVNERNFIFVTVGSGDTFVAICQLLKWISVKRIPLRNHQLQMCASWLDSYALHEDHEYLCRLINGARISHTLQPSAPRGRTRPVTAPKRNESVAVKKLVSHATAAC